VTDWQLVCLAIMAASLAVMATIQVGLIVVGLRAVKQLTATLDEFRREMKPLVAKVNSIADDAAKATSLAVLQVERVDRLIAATAAQVEEAVSILRNAMGGPVRQGAAIFMALRAVFEAFRSARPRERGTPRDDEDAMFVG
jgi:hypothetical protein